MVFMLPFVMQFKDLFKCVCFSVCKGEFEGNLCRKYPFLLFSEMLMSAFLLRFKANYLEKMRGYPNFSLWIPMALAKIYFFCVVLTWCKNLRI